MVIFQKVLQYRIYVKIIRFLIIGPEDIDQRNCIIRGEKKTPKCIYKKNNIRFLMVKHIYTFDVSLSYCMLKHKLSKWLFFRVSTFWEEDYLNFSQKDYQLCD